MENEDEDEKSGLECKADAQNCQVGVWRVPWEGAPFLVSSLILW